MAADSPRTMPAAMAALSTCRECKKTMSEAEYVEYGHKCYVCVEAHNDCYDWSCEMTEKDCPQCGRGADKVLETYPQNPFSHQYYHCEECAQHFVRCSACYKLMPNWFERDYSAMASALEASACCMCGTFICANCEYHRIQCRYKNGQFFCIRCRPIA